MATVAITKDQEMAAHWKTQERFENKYIPEPNSGCWLWTGAYNKQGYGYLTVNGVTARANRISYELHKGPIPAGMYVCHTCDVKSCVNPDHLYAGTPRQNTADMVQRSRFNPRRGENSPWAVLTDEQARAIFIASGKHRDIGKQFGTSQTTVSKIKRGLRYMGAI